MRKASFTQSPYIKINIIFTGIIICVLIYSGIFSPQKSNHPIPSGYSLVTGESTKSTGLSRAFSSIMRFEFDQAVAYNPESLRVFSFFLLQLVFRIIFSLIYSRHPSFTIVVIDILLTLLLFGYCFNAFLPLI